MVDATRPSIRWHGLADAVPGCVAVQMDDRFVHVSDEAGPRFGVGPEALVGTSWRTVFEEADADRLERDALPAARSGGRWEGRVRTDATATAGVVTDLSLSATADGALVWVFTEPDAAIADPPDHLPERGRRLLAQPGFLLALVDGFDGVVYAFDEDGRSQLWNETLVERTGYGHGELAAMGPMDLVAEAHHERIPELIEAIEAGGRRPIRLDLSADDGEPIPHEFRGAAFEHPETGRTYRCVVGRDVAGRLERERELGRYEAIVEGVTDCVYALDEDLEFTYVNDALCETFGLSRADLLGTDAREFFSTDDQVSMADAIRERAVAGDASTGTIGAALPTTDGERSFEARYRLHPEPDGEYRGSVGVIRDVTDRLERERRLERQRDELSTLNRITELLLETVRELVETASRTAVERTVCDRLAASDLYQFAWVGERELDGDRVVPRASAGGDRGSVDPVGVAGGRDDAVEGPVSRAMRTGEVRVATVGESAFDPWRAEAATRGFEAVAAVPLHHGDAVYGVLVVYATRADAFSERERAGFDVLGRTVGFVIHAARSRELLFADSVVEMEFRIGSGDVILGRTADAADCELRLDGYVASGDRWLLYLTVAGAPPGDVVTATEADPDIERARVVAGDGDPRVELVVGTSSLLHAFTAAGATVRTASADPDGVRLTVEAPGDADVRDVVEHVGEIYPDSTLLARRTRDHEVEPAGRPGDVLDGLTDRQREALAVAYRAGYYDWPRGSNAEEIAASIGVASPTLHGHLRKAERTVFSALLDE